MTYTTLHSTKDPFSETISMTGCEEVAKEVRLMLCCVFKDLYPFVGSGELSAVSAFFIVLFESVKQSL